VVENAGKRGGGEKIRSMRGKTRQLTFLDSVVSYKILKNRKDVSREKKKDGETLGGKEYLRSDERKGVSHNGKELDWSGNFGSWGTTHSRVSSRHLDFRKTTSKEMSLEKIKAEPNYLKGISNKKKKYGEIEREKRPRLSSMESRKKTSTQLELEPEK